MRIKFKDDVKLQDVLDSFNDKKDAYDMNGPFDEFIIVDKKSREITQYGYFGLVMDWKRQGLIEQSM